MASTQLEWWQVTNHAVGWAYEAATGTSISSFEFTAGETPLSETWQVVLGLVLYLSTIGGLWKLMQSQSDMPLKTAFAIHNFLLTGASLVLLLLLIEIVAPMYFRHGLYYAICDDASFGNHYLQFAYYLNYLSKYWELVDTVFLVLQKKPLKFLHVYHHSLTMVLCFTQLRGEASVQWVPIMLNVFVHVIMYYYYFLSAIGVKDIWWKQYVTTSQIVQFVIDIVACYFAFGAAYAFRHKLSYTMGSCRGDLNAGLWGCFLLSSYLYLFIEFFYNTYINPKPRKDKRKENGTKDKTT